jgi:Helix-turn-helix domain
MSKDYRTIPATEVLGRLSPARRAQIDERVAQLMAEEVGLSDLRKVKHLTQVQVARKIGGKQVYVSRFEKRSDVKLSKLYKYVDGLGGELSLVVTFPDSDKAYSLKGYKPQPARRSGGRRSKT